VDEEMAVVGPLEAAADEAAAEEASAEDIDDPPGIARP
jgi:hypothetical protein